MTAKLGGTLERLLKALRATVMIVPSPSPRDPRLIGACADPPTAAKVTSLGCRASILLNAVRQVLAGRLEGSAELQANGQAYKRRMPTNSSGAYFDLQLQFGERYAELTDVPLADAISKCTNLRRRFGLWGTPGDLGVGRVPERGPLLRAT